MSDIFISYSHQDRDRARELAERLKQEGWSVFWDRVTPVGKIWSEVLEEELSKTKVIVVLWSNYSVKSNFVRDEAQEGAERKILAPALIDIVKIPLGFRALQTADISTWEYGEADTEGMRLLIEAIARTGNFVKGNNNLSHKDTQKSNGDQLIKEFEKRKTGDKDQVQSELTLTQQGKKNIEEENIPKSRILVVGTGVIKKIDEKTKSLSEELGKKLAQNNFCLVTGGWPGVDEIAARSFSQEILCNDLPLEKYLTQIVATKYKPTYPGGSLILVKSAEEEWTVPIINSDALVLINGIGGTYETAKLAIKLHKPVFPIADSGGDACKVYMEILNTWDQYPYKNIDKIQFMSLGGLSKFVVNELIKLLNLQFG